MAVMLFDAKLKMPGTASGVSASSATSAAHSAHPAEAEITSTESSVLSTVLPEEKLRQTSTMLKSPADRPRFFMRLPVMLRHGLFFLPALCCALLTLWAVFSLRQYTLQTAQNELEAAVDVSRNLFELRMGELEQMLRNNAAFLAHTLPDQVAWEVQLAQQNVSAKLLGHYTLAVVELVESSTPHLKLRLLSSSDGQSSGLGDLAVQSRFLPALRVARSSESMQMVELPHAHTEASAVSEQDRLMEFIYPVPSLANQSGSLRSGKKSPGSEKYLLLIVEMKPLLWTLVGRENQRFGMTVFDTPSTEVQHRVFQANQARTGSVYEPLENLQATRDVLVGSQWWRLQLKLTAETAPRGHFYLENAALLGGGVLTLTLLGLGFMAKKANGYANQLAEKRTQDFFASEARFQRAVNGTRDGIWDIDLHADQTYFSPRFYELLGYPEAADIAVKQPLTWWQSCMPEADLLRWEKQYAMLVRQPQSFELELQLQRQDGSLHWYRLRGVSVINSKQSHQEVAYISGSLTEIQAERDAARREQQLINLSEASPDVVMAFDLEGKVLYINRAGLEIFGTDQINGLGIAQLFSQSDAELLLNEAVPQAFINSVWGGETELITAEGRVIPVSQIVIGHRDVNGEVEYYSTVMRDITEIRKSQQEMRAIKERFERALNATNDGVFERRVGEDLLLMSPRMKQVLGYGPDMPETRQFIYENTHPADRPRLLGLTHRLDRIGGKWSIDVRIRNQQGVYRWLRSRGEVLLDKSGTPELYTGIWSDVTTEKELALELEKHRENLLDMVEERTAKLALARDEAERANQSKSEFLANMSHELRTPMHAILSFAKFGVDKWQHSEPEKLKHWFDNIYKSGSRLLDLLNNLLDLSKLEAGKMHLDLHWQDTRMLAEELVVETEALARTCQIRIELQAIALPAFPETPGKEQPITTYAWVDGTRMTQVLRNLLSNAIKFSPPHSTITVLWSMGKMNLGRRATDTQQVDALVLAVRDQGIGIPEDELESVFDKFVQSSKTKSGAGGTGLGLSICREIVEAHRGTIHAYNNAAASGATFEICLPLLPPAEDSLYQTTVHRMEMP